MDTRLKQSDIHMVGGKQTVDNVIRHQIKEYNLQGKDDAFFVVDLNDIVAKYKKWKLELPRVDVFYAVKCNHDHRVLKALAAIGAGFDCFNKGEVERVLQLGVPAELIMFANPCKPISQLKWANENNISMMTFDNEAELHKIKEYFPESKLVLRLRPDNAPTFVDRRVMNAKFGVTPVQVRDLLTTAKHLTLNVVGVSYHVGCDKHEPSFYVSCLHDARRAFDIGQELGFRFELLDIGGGFSSHSDTAHTFSQVCSALRPSLDELFPASSGVRVIGEPGRYLVSTAFTLAACVTARRTLDPDGHSTETGKPELNSVRATAPQIGHAYYISSGIFQAFMGRMVLGATGMRAVDVYNPEAFEDKPRRPCVLWGNSCAPIDDVGTGELRLPDLDIGDWIVFRDMGEYSISMFSQFGSLPFPEHVYITED